MEYNLTEFGPNDSDLFAIVHLSCKWRLQVISSTQLTICAGTKPPPRMQSQDRQRLSCRDHLRHHTMTQEIHSNYLRDNLFFCNPTINLIRSHKLSEMYVCHIKLRRIWSCHMQLHSMALLVNAAAMCFRPEICFERVLVRSYGGQVT